MNLALFDFDGTLTRRELFADFVHCLASPRRVAFGKPVLAPLVLGYRLGLVPGTVLRAAVAGLAFRGLVAAEAEAAGRRFAADVVPVELRPEAMARVAWHRAQGDTVAVVSGAFGAYLRPWCAAHGLDLLCSELEVDRGRLTGRYQGRQCVGREKARRVRERYRLDCFATIYAYGDTPEDSDLLALAHRRWYRWEEVGEVG